jgi:hypothetical protein
MADLARAARDFVLGLKADAASWCREDRFWPGRALLFLWVAYTLVRSLENPYYWPVIASLNFGIHELGHYVFAPFGLFVKILGGSLFQCLVPVFACFMFLRQRDYFAAAFAFGWLGTNLFYVATYCADARAMQLPVFSPGGGDAYHDWNYLLDDLGLLRHDQRIAFLIRIAATVSMVASLGLMSWLLWHMIQRPRQTLKPE